MAAFVDGVELDGPNDFYSVDEPGTGDQLATVYSCGVADVRRGAAAAAQAAREWAGAPFAHRARVLAVAADRLAERHSELVELAVRDTGATIRLAAAGHVDSAIARLRWWASQTEDVLAVATVPSPSLVCTVRRAPVGVVGCISPYNFPLLSMVGKVAPALLAGNGAVLKPAPQDPLMVGCLTEALVTGLRDVGAPLGLLTLITGPAAELGAAVVADPEIDSISFTGSTAVGRSIGRVAGEQFKVAVLELGGKGALIAREDADLDAVVAGLRETWTIQAGQRCRTPTRLLAYPGVHDELVERLRTEVAGLTVGDPLDPATEVGPVISMRQQATIDSAVAAARDAGLRVTEASLPDPRRGGHYSPPALVDGCDGDSPIMRDEVFGPVVAVMRVQGDAHAVQVANATPYGLTDYVFGDDLDAARAVAWQLRSGGVTINSTARYEHSPFGGNHASGIGREGGLHSLGAATALKQVTEPGEQWRAA